MIVFNTLTFFIALLEFGYLVIPFHAGCSSSTHFPLCLSSRFNYADFVPPYCTYSHPFTAKTVASDESTHTAHFVSIKYQPTQI